jgi:ferredoxin
VFDKNLWRRIIRALPLSSYPKLPCPQCGAGLLSIDASTLTYREIPIASLPESVMKKALSVDADKVALDSDSTAWKFFVGLASAAELLQHTWAKFTVFLECNSCGAAVAACGTAAIPREGRYGFDPKIKVEYFTPSVPMFTLASTTPKSIKDELAEAFRHFHADLTSSGTKLRRAAEQFCVELGEREGQLHRRIERLSKSFPTEASWLSRLKWVGNEATHAGNIEEEDLLHSFEIFEELVDVFRRRQKAALIEQTICRLDEKFRK